MSGSLTFMISALLIGVVGIDLDSGVSYTVRDVIAVEQPAGFACRLRDYSWPTQVRFTVQLRGVISPDDPNGVLAGRQFLYEQFNDADQIRLHNVVDHGYFNLTAEVFVDGRNVAAEMLDREFLQPAPVPEVGTDEMPEQRWDFPPVVFDDDSHVPVRPVKRVGGRQGLMREIDLSRINPDTTFQEALAIICGPRSGRLPILVMWNDLERNAFVEKDTPVGVEISGPMRAGQALDLVLHSVARSGVRLRVFPEGGVLTIATEHAQINRRQTKVYAVGDLLGPRSPSYW